MCQSTPRAELELPVSREAPALAREFLRGSTCAEHHSAVVDDAVLLVSELVTNSVLVAEMSDDWGVDPEPDGKHVWFVIR
jgi:hypothetical protein